MTFDCVRHCCTCLAVHYGCYHGSGSVLFYDFIQEGLWSVENACSIQVLSSAGAGFCLWCFCECQIWGGGEGRGARSRKGSGIVFPCSKQNNLCVIISMLIVCWGSVIPRIGAQVFFLRGMEEGRGRGNFLLCVRLQLCVVITGTSGSSVPGNLTMGLNLWEARRDPVCKCWC